MLEIAEQGGVIKKVSTRYELPGGTRAFGKEINENPEQVFTKDILLAIDEYAKKRFQYGSMIEDYEKTEEANERELAEISDAPDAES